MLRVNSMPQIPGMMMIWPTDTAPAGWLLCYGQAILRSTYGKLFAVIGTTFGVGDGTTTFNLPDFRGRSPLVKDDLGGVSANRVTNAQADTIGGSAGDEEMPEHLHDIRVGVSGTGNEIGLMSYQYSQMKPTESAGTGVNNMSPYLTIACIIKF